MREKSFYAMSIFELRNALNQLIDKGQNLNGDDYKNNSLNIDVCFMVLEEKELEMCHALAR